MTFEKSFSEVTTLLVNHLKGKPEVRDLMDELQTSMHFTPAHPRTPDAPASAGSLRAAAAPVKS